MAHTNGLKFPKHLRNYGLIDNWCTAYQGITTISVDRSAQSAAYTSVSSSGTGAHRQINQTPRNWWVAAVKQRSKLRF